MSAPSDAAFMLHLRRDFQSCRFWWKMSSSELLRPIRNLDRLKMLSHSCIIIDLLGFLNVSVLNAPNGWTIHRFFFPFFCDAGSLLMEQLSSFHHQYKPLVQSGWKCTSEQCIDFICSKLFRQRTSDYRVSVILIFFVIYVLFFQGNIADLIK